MHFRPLLMWSTEEIIIIKKKSGKYNSAKFYELNQRFLKYTESGKSKYVTGGSIV